MDHKTTFAADPDVVACELDGGSALLDLSNSTYYSLNPVGAEVWTSIAQPTSLDAIVLRIEQAFDVDASRCRADVLALLDDLCAKRLANRF